MLCFGSDIIRTDTKIISFNVLSHGVVSLITCVVCPINSQCLPDGEAVVYRGKHEKSQKRKNGKDNNEKIKERKGKHEGGWIAHRLAAFLRSVWNG